MTADNEEDLLISSTGGNQFLVFQAGIEFYGLEVLTVKEIIQYSGITRVPRTPAYIKGVVNLRGSVLPVVDLPALFDGKSAEITRRACIIIVEFMLGEDTLEAGILVDSVETVLEIAPDSIEAAPQFGSGVKTEFIRGMARSSDRFIILLNLEMVLAPEHIGSFHIGVA